MLRPTTPNAVATDLGPDGGVVEWCVGRSLHVYGNAFAPAGKSFLEDLDGLEVDAFRPAFA